MQLNLFPVVLEEAYFISPRVKHFVFKAQLETPFKYVPGQFITVHFEKDGKTLRRSYSVFNSPENNNRIEFAAGQVEGGPGTDLLFNLKPGDAININGPFGRLILKDTLPKRIILMATSTGITPFCAMLPSLANWLNASKENSLVILQGVQYRQDKLYTDMLSQFVDSHPNAALRFYLSREEQPEQSQHEHSGYVQEAFKEININPEQDIVYLCGNPGMIDESFNLLKENGFGTQNVIREKYISN